MTNNAGLTVAAFGYSSSESGRKPLWCALYPDGSFVHYSDGWGHPQIRTWRSLKAAEKFVASTTEEERHG